MQSTDRAHFNALYTQAAVLYETKRYSETIAYAHKAMAILPEDPKPYAIIALAMAYMKNPEASEWARKAIAKDPTNGLYRGYLSLAYTIRGKWKKGLQPMREGVALSPENAWLQSGFGHCLMHAKKFREAVTHLQKAVELDPQNAFYHLRLSNGLERIKDWEGGERHLKIALALKPDDANAQATLGWRLRVRGDGSKADETFREALRLNPQSRIAKLGLGAPAGRRAGPTDAILRFSLRIISIRRRRLLNALQVLLFFGFLTWILVGPYGGLWQVQLIAASFLAWIIYFTFVWQVVRVISKWREVYFH